MCKVDKETLHADVPQMVEGRLGKANVGGSIPPISSMWAYSSIGRAFDC